MSRARGGLLPVLLLALAPVLAYAPALAEGRILAPGDGAALHLPLRVEAWRAWARGELPSWNPSSFSGTPLLASYRPGALHPLMPALSLLAPLAAFQVLVLVALAATGPLCYAYARRLGAERVGAFVAGLGFALGPYLVAQLEDTATLVAAPSLVLALLTAEAHLVRGRASSGAALAAAVALLLLSGSPVASTAGGLLLAVRLTIAVRLRSLGSAGAVASVGAMLAAILAGLLLAGPQLVPTLIALSESGPGGIGAASSPAAPLAGMSGLVVRSVSHTPAPVFALAAVPLLAAAPGLREAAVIACLALLGLTAAGRLDAPGAVPLALDLGLSLLAGLSLSAQWRSRRERRGRRLRALALVAALFAAAALSIATAVTGPLDARLAAPVGLLALGLILYFALAESRSPLVAQVFLLPLVASFLMQPWGRLAWAGAPTPRELEQPTPTREAVDRAMGPRRAERTLVLAGEWPRGALANDLAWANLATFAGRRNANGYDPLVPEIRRRSFDGMRADGTLPRSLLTTDPGRLELLGIRWLQVATETLANPAGSSALGDELDVVVEGSRPHLLALPITRATEVRIVSFLAGATEVEQGRIVAECVVRLATGRELWLPIRAGVDTAEWAWDRSDVRPLVRHSRPEPYASFPAAGGFEGHQYSSKLRLPGRFLVSALRFRSWPGAPPLWLLRAGLRDAVGERSIGVSLVSAHTSDEVRLAQVAATPRVSLFELRRGVGPAWVVESLRRVPDRSHVLELLRSPTRLGVDARREALASQGDVAGLELPAGGRSAPADVAVARGGRIVIRAAGPGLLVVSEGFDAGWTARVDRRPARVVRVNGDRMAVVLGEGHHRVVLRHRPRGLALGAALALVGLAGLGAAALRARRRSRG